MSIVESYGLLSLRQQAAIPPMDISKKNFKIGMCGMNVDGNCISSGTKVSGSRGYRLASMGYPMEQAAAEGGEGSGGYCATFPLWYNKARQYELWGIQLSTSRNPLLARSPYS